MDMCDITIDMCEMTMELCDVTMDISQLIPSCLPSFHPHGMSIERSSHIWDGAQCSAQPPVGSTRCLPENSRLGFHTQTQSRVVSPVGILHGIALVGTTEQSRDPHSHHQATPPCPTSHQCLPVTLPEPFLCGILPATDAP